MEQDLAPLVALALLASQLTTLVRFVQGGQLDRAVNTMLPWATALAALALGSQVEATSALVLPGVDQPLGDLDIWSLLYVSVVVGSTGGAFHKVVVGFDHTQSAAEPPLRPAGRE